MERGRFWAAARWKQAAAAAVISLVRLRATTVMRRDGTGLPRIMDRLALDSNFFSLSLLLKIVSPVLPI
jgi:hypothetical protein